MRVRHWRRSWRRRCCSQYDECALLTPFVRAHRAVFHVEYREPPSAFCAESRRPGLSSMQKKPNLGGVARAVLTAVRRHLGVGAVAPPPSDDRTHPGRRRPRGSPAGTVRASPPCPPDRHPGSPLGARRRVRLSMWPRPHGRW
ncbi:endo alpha-1,4 polygalactosaminidase [Streptomyces sp. Ag109_O5-1]|uniref:endo alpha-1,4 polygalactosaminidase n=1 Tax=Streptomyces sp. Ag109_O5-1 TaxID=1938851 RepID=UPI000F50BA77|nr:endo alpha-1,4 polygalactosaminidase [Streptomyces sp. Ag109_O5-1]